MYEVVNIYWPNNLTKIRVEFTGTMQECFEYHLNVLFKSPHFAVVEAK